MNINFSKYQGSGNDFIIIDNRLEIPINHTIDIPGLCDRNFGIGADGLILINKSVEKDFRMVYYNADGKEADMCGNGVRCAIAFIYEKDARGSEFEFISKESFHKGKIVKQINHNCHTVKVNLKDPEIISQGNDYSVINTGVPHYVSFADDTQIKDFVAKAREIRYAPEFGEKGVNVNFASIRKGCIDVRTYERGVENETLSCGTGVTATAIAAFLAKNIPPPIHIKARGGELYVNFTNKEGKITDVYLQGPACKVFEGSVEI